MLEKLLQKIGLSLAVVATSCSAPVETLVNPSQQIKTDTGMADGGSTECPQGVRISDRSYELRDFPYAFTQEQDIPTRIVVGSTDDPAVNTAAANIAGLLLRGMEYRFNTGDCVRVRSEEDRGVNVCLKGTSQTKAEVDIGGSVEVISQDSSKVRNGVEVYVKDVFDEEGTELDSATLRIRRPSSLVKSLLDVEVPDIYAAPTIVVGSRYHNSAVLDYFGVNKGQEYCIPLEAGLIAGKTGRYAVMIVTADNPQTVRAASLVLRDYVVMDGDDPYSDIFTDDVTAVKVEGEEATGIRVSILEQR
ncbi:MAG: hypothetical protein WC595_00565 [Candidatus Nanoarchaeia archaeon]